MSCPPFENNVEQLRAYDSRKYNRDTKIPRILTLDSLLGGVADADPKAEKYAQSDQDSIGGYAEIAELKKSGEHLIG